MVPPFGEILGWGRWWHFLALYSVAEVLVAQFLCLFYLVTLYVLIRFVPTRIWFFWIPLGSEEFPLQSFFLFLWFLSACCVRIHRHILPDTGIGIYKPPRLWRGKVSLLRELSECREKQYYRSVRMFLWHLRLRIILQKIYSSIGTKTEESFLREGLITSHQFGFLLIQRFDQTLELLAA